MASSKKKRKLAMERRQTKDIERAEAFKAEFLHEQSVRASEESKGDAVHANSSPVTTDDSITPRDAAAQQEDRRLDTSQHAATSAPACDQEDDFSKGSEYLDSNGQKVELKGFERALISRVARPGHNPLLCMSAGKMIRELLRNKRIISFLREAPKTGAMQARRQVLQTRIAEAFVASQKELQRVDNRLKSENPLLDYLEDVVRDPEIVTPNELRRIEMKRSSLLAKFYAIAAGFEPGQVSINDMRGAFAAGQEYRTANWEKTTRYCFPGLEIDF